MRPCFARAHSKCTSSLPRCPCRPWLSTTTARTLSAARTRAALSFFRSSTARFVDDEEVGGCAECWRSVVVNAALLRARPMQLPCATARRRSAPCSKRRRAAGQSLSVLCPSWLDLAAHVACPFALWTRASTDDYGRFGTCTRRRRPCFGLRRSSTWLPMRRCVFRLDAKKQRLGVPVVREELASLRARHLHSLEWPSPTHPHLRRTGTL